MAVVVAIDAGTTGVRAAAVDEDGAVRRWAYRELAQHYPRPGWVEHDPGEICDAVQATLDQLRASLTAAGETVAPGRRPLAALGAVGRRSSGGRARKPELTTG